MVYTVRVILLLAHVGNFSYCGMKGNVTKGVSDYM